MLSRLPKKFINLKEEYTTYVDSTKPNPTPEELVNKAKTENPNAKSVVFDGELVDGNSSTAPDTQITTNNTPQGLKDAKELAKKASDVGKDTTIKVKLGESITFTKGELGMMLKML